MEVAGKVVIVTGASSGIGRAAALAFARKGARVVVTARREERLRVLVEECRAASPGAAGSDHLAGDLGERGFAEHLVDETVRRAGGLDVLVNNAGMPLRESIYRVSVEKAEHAMRVNFFSCLWTTFAAVPHLLERGGGAIVNVSSFATRVVPPYEAIYAATKGAMNGLTEGLWTDLAGSGIHVALVLPGPIATEIWDRGDRPSFYDGAKYPPETVADAIVECVEKERHEVIVPNLARLRLASVLRVFAPGLLRASLAKLEPVPPEDLAEARARARAGKRLGVDDADRDGASDDTV